MVSDPGRRCADAEYRDACPLVVGGANSGRATCRQATANSSLPTRPRSTAVVSGRLLRGWRGPSRPSHRSTGPGRRCCSIATRNVQPGGNVASRIPRARADVPLGQVVHDFESAAFGDCRATLERRGTGTARLPSYSLAWKERVTRGSRRRRAARLASKNDANTISSPSKPAQVQVHVRLAALAHRHDVRPQSACKELAGGFGDMDHGRESLRRSTGGFEPQFSPAVPETGSFGLQVPIARGTAVRDGPAGQPKSWQLAVAGGAFELEHPALGRETARRRKAGQRPARGDDPMARDDDRSRVPAQRYAHVARRVRSGDGSRDLAVAPRAAGRGFAASRRTPRGGSRRCRGGRLGRRARRRPCPPAQRACPRSRVGRTLGGWCHRSPGDPVCRARRAAARP